VAAKMVDVNQVYNYGIAAYYKGDYLDSKNYIEKAIELFHESEETEDRCQGRCGAIEPEAEFANSSEMSSMARIVRRAACLDQCFADAPLQIERARDQVRAEIETLYCYNYLQILYHQIGDGIKAVDAAHTYLQRYSANEEMLENLAFYKTHYPEVQRRIDRENLLDRESTALNRALASAITAYENGAYGQCVTMFETTIGHIR